MAFNYSPKIVTAGLVLYLDAANARSYPGTGTTWTDLSRSGNNGTLTNGPTFNSGNGGNIVFDGTNDYSSVNVNLLPFSQITVEIWFKLSTTSNAILFEHGPNWNSTAGGFGLSVNSNGNTNDPTICHTAFWNAGNLRARNYAFTCGTQNYSCHTNIYSNISDPTGRLTYVNGNLIPYTSIGGYPTTTATTSGSTFRDAIMFLASRAGSTGFLNGNIASIKIYNIKLSSTEILQNYNATKTRFGL